MFDLITIGDSVIDTFVPLKEAEVGLVKGQRMLSLRFGDKVEVDPLFSLVGGNAANSAVGGARLKLKTATYTNVGNDHDKHLILTQFKENKVDSRYVIENEDLPTDHHVVLEFQGERTILVYHQPWNYKLPDLEQARWVYFTSLGPNFIHTDITSQVTQYLERTGARLLFNPGTFQIKHGIKKFPRLLSLTEVLIMNKEEAKLTLGFEENEKVPIKKLLKGLLDFGPKLVVITDALDGSYGFDGEKYFSLEAFPAKVLQNTGAGDAYAIAVLAGLFHGKEFPEAMRWGAANGAAVVESLGPETGLLSYEKIQESLKENSKIEVKEI